MFPAEPLSVTVDDQELLQTSFEPTELMSTYVLALAVCDFASRGTRLADDTLVRTFQPGSTILEVLLLLWCSSSAPCWALRLTEPRLCPGPGLGP